MNLNLKETNEIPLFNLAIRMLSDVINHYDPRHELYATRYELEPSMLKFSMSITDVKELLDDRIINHISDIAVDFAKKYLKTLNIDYTFAFILDELSYAPDETNKDDIEIIIKFQIGNKKKYTQVY